MEDIGLSLIVSAIASLVSAAVGIVLFLPFLLWISWSIPDDQSPGFKIRTFIASQVIFWGSLVFAGLVDPPSVGKFIGNGISFFFNLVLIVYATGIGMRAAMRIRNAIKGQPAPQNVDLDLLEKRLKVGESARDIASKVRDVLK